MFTTSNVSLLNVHRQRRFYLAEEDQFPDWRLNSLSGHCHHHDQRERNVQQLVRASDSDERSFLEPGTGGHQHVIRQI